MTAAPPPTAAPPGVVDISLRRLTSDPRRAERITHLERLPARKGRPGRWPDWVPELLRARLRSAGVEAPWEHQTKAAESAYAGVSTVVATGTASGKSLCYLLPTLSALLAPATTRPDTAPATRPDTAPATRPDARVLYLAPTKALAADQLRALTALDLPSLRAATYDGDTPVSERDWAREHAQLVLTNPDMLHHGMLPGHARWASFLRRLRYVVIDECHAYRGVFGSHVAHVLRRLTRICARYGAEPVFLLASATVTEPAGAASKLTGCAVTEVTADASPRGPLDFALWEPPLTEPPSERDAPVRRSATAEAADLLTDLAVSGARTLAFVRSRRGAEMVALSARRALAEVSPELTGRVAAYRAGYLPEERRDLEAALHRGDLLAVATTNALELGVDIAGLDAVVLTGYPGTLASLWQQAGRAGREGRSALAVLVARDDPLDAYLVHHPEAVFGRSPEATVLDPANPHVLGPHLCCAAAELPLTEDDVAHFGPSDLVAGVLDDLVRRGLLRRRARGWFWTRRDRPSELADLRGAGGAPVRVVEAGTGRLLGTVDADAAHSQVHSGAVYLHQGETFVVDHLDLTEAVALAHPDSPDYSTMARDTTTIRVVESLRARSWPGVELHDGTVEVTNQVVSFLRRRVGSGQVLGEEPLDLPPRQLRTRAVWYTVSAQLLALAGVGPAQVPGAAHAAEHAAIGLLPLFATCDRWDIGGVSTADHDDTGATTVFVYDGHPGGAGFAARGYDAAARWLRATRDAIAACECDAGCPSCVQSPKCGNGNTPLDKPAALRLLTAVLDAGLGV